MLSREFNASLILSLKLLNSLYGTGTITQSLERIYFSLPNLNGKKGPAASHMSFGIPNCRKLNPVGIQTLATEGDGGKILFHLGTPKLWAYFKKMNQAPFLHTLL